ncbi:hypothetical protein PINS_up023460 [Pythium insidiosum]|nr:hypothetical protein PINS_up023460 [Pythium insidiosum]
MEPQCLGRYSVDKLLLLQAFHDGTSLARSYAVIGLTSLPVLVVAGVMLGGQPQFTASTVWPPPVSFVVWTAAAYSLLAVGAILPFRQALRLSELSYSSMLVAIVALCSGLGSQGVNLLVSRVWTIHHVHWPRLVLLPWMLLLLLTHTAMLHKLLSRKWRRVKRYLHVFLLQWLIIGFSVGVSVTLVELSDKQSPVLLPLCVAWFLLSPVLKTVLRYMCWDPTRRLLDLSTDISICMIEMLWSVLNVAWLSTTASSHALSLVDLVLLLVVLAAVETLDAAMIIGTFSRRAFIVDGATALGTAISIVKSALFPAASTAGTTPSPDAASLGRPRRPTIDCQSRESFSVSSPDRALPVVTTRSSCRLRLPWLSQIVASRSADRYKPRRSTARPLSQLSAQHFFALRQLGLSSRRRL